MSGAQAWHIVLNGMKAANAGWITRIEAEHYSASISLALKTVLVNHYAKGD